MKIGILSLQGNYFHHVSKLFEMGVESYLVRDKVSLFKCDGLIIPGGESTAMSNLLDFQNLRKSFDEIKEKINIFGVCAGMILLSKTNNYKNLNTLGIMDFTVERNSWGRQIYSFDGQVNLSFNNKNIVTTFIRAPRVDSFSKNIDVLATYEDIPVLLTDGKHLASSFHPEYSTGFEVYDYFINLIN